MNVIIYFIYSKLFLDTFLSRKIKINIDCPDKYGYYILIKCGKSKPTILDFFVPLFNFIKWLMFNNLIMQGLYILSILFNSTYDPSINKNIPWFLFYYSYYFPKEYYLLFPYSKPKISKNIIYIMFNYFNQSFSYY